MRFVRRICGHVRLDAVFMSLLMCVDVVHVMFVSRAPRCQQHGALVVCLSNSDYLLFINQSAGRSFLDLTQYPVMPWARWVGCPGLYMHRK